MISILTIDGKVLRWDHTKNDLPLDYLTSKGESLVTVFSIIAESRKCVEIIQDAFLGIRKIHGNSPEYVAWFGDDARFIIANFDFVSHLFD